MNPSVAVWNGNNWTWLVADAPLWLIQERNGEDMSRVIVPHLVDVQLGGFMCGRPTAGTVFQAAGPLDGRCNICDWLNTPQMRRAATEGGRMLGP